MCLNATTPFSSTEELLSKAHELEEQFDVKRPTLPNQLQISSKQACRLRHKPTTLLSIAHSATYQDMAYLNVEPKSAAAKPEVNIALIEQEQLALTATKRTAIEPPQSAHTIYPFFREELSKVGSVVNLVNDAPQAFTAVTASAIINNMETKVVLDSGAAVYIMTLAYPLQLSVDAKVILQTDNCLEFDNAIIIHHMCDILHTTKNYQALIVRRLMEQ